MQLVEGKMYYGRETLSVVIEDVTMQAAWAIIKQNRYKEDGPVMLVGPFQHGGSIVCEFKQMRTTDEGKRLPIEIPRVGRARIMQAMEDGRYIGIRIVFDPGRFPDVELFWQAAHGLYADLESAVEYGGEDE